jgi:polysaccharide export outer membrane protein
MKKAVLLILISSCFFACVSSKKLTYFNESESALALTPKPGDHLISTGDVLRIVVSSPNVTSQMDALSKAEITIPSDGRVDVPILTSPLMLKGFTLKRAEDTLALLLSANFEKPHVVVSLISFPIIVMGEVRRPGIIMVPGENINLIQALILAGDADLYAKRSDVKVIRGQDAETQTVFNIDMTSMDVFKSPAYYLKSNDIVYIPPFKSKGLTLTTPVLLLSLSAFSSIIIIYTLISK